MDVMPARYSLFAIRHSRSYEVPMPAHTMSHFTILTRDVAATEAFYGELLGLKTGYRPPISRPGVWLYADSHPILHVIDPVNMPKEPAGVLDHMAFNATGLKEVAGKLKQRGIDYALSQQGETGTWQMFFLDVNGAKVELNFASDEPGAPELRTR
jgi:catechol 2,3-dioxygenase-like lactoylglutathione lyase family enzyme